MRSGLVAAALLATAPFGCAPLEEIPPNRCGDRVLDASEYCDDVPGSWEGATYDCRPAGEPGECHFSCETGGCPPGFGCGADHACRRPAGRFGEMTPIAVDPAVLVANQLDVGDFDGDGALDVLVSGVSGLVVIGVGAGDPDPGTPLAFHDPQPAVGNLDGADGDDLAVHKDAAGGVGGIGVLLGRADGFGPTAYPILSLKIPDARLALLDVRLGPGDDVVTVTQGLGPLSRECPAESCSVVFAPDLFGDDDLLLHQLHGAPVGSLAPRVAGGRLNEAVPCDALALAPKEGSKIIVTQQCRPNGTGGFAPNRHDRPRYVPPRVLDVDGKVTTAPLVFDLDGDGHLDLIVGAEKGGDAFACVAYGLGDGRFRSSPGGPPDDRAAPFLDVALSGPPLAVAHLDDDGVADWVDTCAIRVSASQAGKIVYQALVTDPAAPSKPCKKGTWTEAAVADFNADGRLDVAVASDFGEVSAYAGTASGFFVRRTLFFPESPTDSALLSVGDYNGDGVSDLAFSRPATPAEGDLVAVAFGEAGKGLGEPRSIGAFHDVRGLCSGNLAATTDTTTDGLAELCVVVREKNGETSFALLPGDPEGRLESPFGLVVSGDPGDPQKGQPVFTCPLATAVGRFTGADDVEDIAVFARLDQTHVDKADQGMTNPAPRLWLLPVASRAVIENATPTLLDYDPKTPPPLLATVPSPGSDPPRLAVLATRVESQMGSLRVARAKKDGGVWAFELEEEVPLEERFASGDTAAFGDPGDGCAPWSLPWKYRALSEDLDADGHADLIAVGYGSDGTALLVVYWSESGSFSTERKSTMPIDAADFSSFAVLETDGDPGREIALLTPQGAYLVDVIPGSPAPALGAPTPIDGVFGAGVPLAVAAADVTADGVDDLLVVVPDGERDALHIYPGVAAPPPAHRDQP
jgi:hypothetical protein